MSVLIICEKPSVAKTVALALGAAEQKDGYLSGDGLCDTGEKYVNYRIEQRK